MAGYREPLEDAQFFKLSEPCQYMPPENSHVVSRSTVRVIPQTGTEYNSNGNRVVRIILPSTGFLDTQNSYLLFELLNTTTDAKTDSFGFAQGTGVASLFQRVRIMVDGSVIEDINAYNLIANMLFRCGRSNAPSENDATTQQGFMEGYADNQKSLKGLYCEDYYQFMHKPMNGVLNNIRYLPLAYIGEMTIEITLEEPKTVFQDTRVAPTGTTLSTDYAYALRNFYYQCDILQFDSEYIQGFESSMLARGINIPFDTFTHYKSTVNSIGDLVINHRGRNVKNLWTMLRSSKTVTEAGNASLVPKRCGITSWQLRIGAFMKPLLPVRISDKMTVESFVEFLKTLTGFNRIQNGSVDVLASMWATDAVAETDATKNTDNSFFVVGVDLEREGQISSGLDTASEATPITLALTGDGTSDQVHMDTFIHAGANLIISSPHEVTLFT